MKTTSLFQLGAIAVLLSRSLFGIGNLMLSLSGGQLQNTLGIWLGIIGNCFRVLGVVALFRGRRNEAVYWD